jgi:hypothetical protein
LDLRAAGGEAGYHRPPELAELNQRVVEVSYYGSGISSIARARTRGEVLPGDPRLHAFSLMGPMVMAMRFREVFGGVGSNPPDFAGARRPACPHAAARPAAAIGRQS